MPRSFGTSPTKFDNNTLLKETKMTLHSFEQIMNRLDADTQANEGFQAMLVKVCPKKQAALEEALAREETAWQKALDIAENERLWDEATMLEQQKLQQERAKRETVLQRNMEEG